ncbi:MAG: RNase adapter RapZ [Lachnospiraceae bacterium]|nr:RNase adapter RapZ [Lachnospiraceae bacterium]
MRFVIVTGMSGAGKRTALKMLEDAGYFCVDNLPVPLVDKFAELATNPAQEYGRVALGLDVRSIHEPQAVERLIHMLESGGYPFEILFLEAGNQTLVKRYKESRRSHPLSRSGRIDEGIERERRILQRLKQQANYIIDTSQLLTRDLHAELDKIFVEQQEYRNLFITVLSFGFKYGIPEDADLVFDVRFLPNPYYVEELKYKTGNDREVQDYVMHSQTARIFVEKLTDLTDFLLPNYIAEGKNQLVIAVGCTGGKHRSVTLANRLYEFLSKKKEYGVKIEHRDLVR